MKNVTTVIFSIMFLFIMTAFSFAGDDKPEVKVKVAGTVQAWGSYAQTNTDTAQVGFGLRRVRLRFYGSIGDNVKTFVQLETTSPKLLDARIQWKINDNMEIRMGRFIAAGVRGGGLTSHTKLDIVERPESARLWASRTVGADYRDYGVALFGKAKDFKYNVWVHNGAGAANIRPSNRGTAGVQTQGVAVAGMVTYMPKSVKGLEAGAHYGMGNKYLNEYNSYSAYLYYEPKPVRFKAEYIALSNIDALGSGVDLEMMGFYVFGAFRVTPNWELVGRFESLDPNTDDNNGGKDDERTDITVGATYSWFPAAWGQTKATFAYVIQNEAATTVDNNYFYMMWQVLF